MIALSARRALALAAAVVLAAGAPAEASGGWSGPFKLTWYGPGYYGNRTACGQRYTPHIIGVATWLPLRCGTMVDLRWRKRTITVPVIDRMPRHPGIAFDASAEVACRLFNPPKQWGLCFTRTDVRWRIAR